MKTVILAGGLATRMGPYTEEIPKGMVEIRGKPFLLHQFNLLKKQELTDLILCVAYQYKKIEDYFWDGKKFGLDVKYSVEEDELLGTAGAVKSIKFDLGERFIVIYGDILTTMDFKKLLEFHKTKKALATIVVHKKTKPVTTSIITLKDDNKVDSFLEKPTEEQLEKVAEKEHYVNSAIYVLEREVLNLIPEEKFDFSKQLFPLMLQKGLPVYGYPTDESWIEVGTSEKLENFKKSLKEGLFSF